MPETEKPRAKPGMSCPLMQRDMSKVCHTCALWSHLRGKDPQGEGTIDEWRCSLAWLPVLLVENSQMERQTGAAVESARNEMKAALDGVAAVVVQAVAAFAHELKQDRDHVLATAAGIAIGAAANGTGLLRAPGPEDRG